MGKSLRSKRVQAVKRQRREKYKKKEILRLKEMLEAAGEKVSLPGSDCTMKDINNKESAVERADQSEPPLDSLRNDHGNYPVWMNQRQVRRQKRRGNAPAFVQKKVSNRRRHHKQL